MRPGSKHDSRYRAPARRAGSAEGVPGHIGRRARGGARFKLYRSVGSWVFPLFPSSLARGLGKRRLCPALSPCPAPGLSFLICCAWRAGPAWRGALRKGPSTRGLEADP